MRSTFILSAVFALATAQSTSNTAPTTTEDVQATNPTPDALDLEGIRDVPEPTYAVVDGLMDFDVPYESEIAMATASAEVIESPLTLFPAATTVPMNAGGENAGATATNAAVKRGIVYPSRPDYEYPSTPEKRGVVYPSRPDYEYPSTPEKRGVVYPSRPDYEYPSSIEKRAACATQATIPNYYNVNVTSYSSFKADSKIADVANNATVPQGYYQTVKNALGANSAYGYLGYSVVKTYDVAACAAKCTSKNGCLAFNIYFERDPVLEPGTGCENPDAFANIKCSFWGSALDSTTANNYGQWRSKFQVGIAGSNAYTSYSIGGPVAGWETPLSLNNTAMNAPLRDCAGTWTYMGYKLLTSGPFDPSLCAAACDAQTQYNINHPPTKGFAPRCAAFGTYLLTKTNSTGSYPQGQMCTMYTSAWGAQYAVNKASYDDSIGAKYTYSLSYFYSKTSQQPVCPSDVSYLQSSAAEFCTSFLSYTPSTSTVYTTSTPPVSTVLETSTDVEYPTSTVTDYTTSLVATTITLLGKRAVQTPASITNWPAAKISEGCAQVVTGVVTSTSTTQASAPLTTLVTTVRTTASAVTVTTIATTTIVSQALAGTNGKLELDYDTRGFSANTAGSLMQWSATGFYDQDVVYTGSTTDHSIPGYVFHVPSGLCITVLQNTTNATTDVFDSGSVTLATCGTTSVPPPNQRFGFTWGLQCLVFYGDRQNIQSWAWGAYYTPVNGDNSEVTFTIGDGDCFWFQRSS